jgi:hypothetical protein
MFSFTIATEVAWLNNKCTEIPKTKIYKDEYYFKVMP